MMEIFTTIICQPILDSPSCNDIQYLVNRLHGLGINNELVSSALYGAALQKSVVIFKLKCDLRSLEKNDPICVTSTKEQEEFVKQRHDQGCEQMKNLFNSALQLRSTKAWKIRADMAYTYYFLFGYYHQAIDIIKMIIEDYKVDRYVFTTFSTLY